jgi:dienelactone hydrolase
MTTLLSGTFDHQGVKYTIDKYSEAGGPPKRPVVVIVHGTDGMGGSSGPQIRSFAEQIAAAGFAVFIPHYFNSSDGADTDPVPVLFQRRIPRVRGYGPRVKAGVEYAMSQADSDSGRVGVVGLSLGGGLAVEYAENAGSAKVQALVVFFGFIWDRSLYANADRLPPTLLLHNEKDGFVDSNYSTELEAALQNNRVPCRKEFLPDDNLAQNNHPFKADGDADRKSRAMTLDWLKKYLMPSIP